MPRPSVAEGTLLDRRDGRRLRRRSWAGASRPGAAIPTCRSSSTAGTRSSSPSRARSSRRATGSAGRARSSTRSSRRSARSASTTKRGIELGQEYVKLVVARDADHPADVLQRVHGDGRRPTGPATRRAEDPYTNPVPNWANSRYMMVKLSPTKHGAELSGSRAAGGPPRAACSRRRGLAMSALRHLSRQAAGAVRAGRLHRHQHHLPRHASDADRSGRADRSRRRPRSAARAPRRSR